MIPILINTNAEIIENAGIRILFDNDDIDTNYVMGLSQSVEMFNNQFKLGSTLCRTISLQVDKGGIKNHPSCVKFLDQDNDLLYTLFVDEIDESNDFYYTYNLTDVMVRMNVEFEYDKDAGLSVMDLLELICSNHDIELVNDSLYLSDMVISWTQSGMSERDFISYVAEVNGGYAYINNEGNLIFAKFSNTSKGTIDSDDCSSIKIGEKHLIDRVFVELASASYGYPEQPTNNETIYINSDNFLLTDSGSYTIQTIINHIYNDINGFVFYNIEVEKCPIIECRCGDIISFKFNNTLYPTIAQIDLDYSSGWLGGYSLQLENATQCETKVKSGLSKVRNEIQIIVDRELGTITQRITNVEQSVETIEEGAIFKVDVLYAKGDSSTQAPTTGWSTNAPEWEDGKYIWQKTKTYYGDETSSESNPTCIQGAKGQSGVNGKDGKDGEDGIGISSIVEQYYLSSSNVEPTGGEWSNTCPSWQKNKYIWTRSFITWNDETTSTTTPIVANALNSANEIATNTYTSLTTYYSTTEQTNSAITTAVSGSKTEILGEVSNTYATQSSLSLYVKEEDAPSKIASWINATADNIVLNASSSLVFGDTNNQYITISNYKDESDVKVGVLFDGTGQVMIKPEGKFDVQNYIQETMYNQFKMEYSSSKSKIELWNSDGTYNSNSITMTHQSYTNNMLFYNYCRDCTNVTNTMYMGNWSGGSEITLTNYYPNQTRSTNEIDLLANANASLLTLNNRKPQTNGYNNRLEMEGFGVGSWNRLTISNYDCDNETASTSSNYICLYKASSWMDNYIEFNARSSKSGSWKYGSYMYLGTSRLSISAQHISDSSDHSGIKIEFTKSDGYVSSISITDYGITINGNTKAINLNSNIGVYYNGIKKW